MSKEKKEAAEEKVESVVDNTKEVSHEDLEALKSFTQEIREKVESLEKADIEKQETIEALNEVISRREGELEKAGEEIAKLLQELETTQAKLALAEKEIADAAERDLLSSRLDLLAVKNLLRSSEEDQIKQATKIKEMSNEEFSAYVEDLEDIKNQILASIKPTSEAVAKTEETPKGVSKEEATVEQEESSEKEETSELEQTVEQIAEEVSKDQNLDEGTATEAVKLIKELLAQASQKAGKATAKKEETVEEESTTVSPTNFESAAILRPKVSRDFSSLGKGFAERLSRK